jgi:lysozyme family protein
LIELYSARRLEFLQSLRTFPTFGKGWSRRVAEVKEKALEMVE